MNFAMQDGSVRSIRTSIDSRTLRLLGAMNDAKGWRRQEEMTGPVDNAGKRLMGFALESDIHDERLWMPIAKATGALGNTSCLVGTPEHVADVRPILEEAASFSETYSLGPGREPEVFAASSAICFW